MIARVAAGLARNPAPEHRWRRVAVPVTAAVFMLLALAATGVVAMVQRETERTAQRTALLASTPSPTDLFLVARDDNWRGRPFSVAWIESASPGTKPVLPPGMARLPEPGQATVSPALDRLASSDPSLAARYPNRLVLGTEGVRSGGELLAYVRTPEGRTLAEDERALRVREFDSPTGAARSYEFDMPSSVTVVPVVGGVLALLVVPGLIVLAVGAATASGVRDHRFEVLRYMGASGWTLIALAVLETLILAAPGLLASAVLWGVIGPRLGQVPLVGHELVRGDLGLPWWLLTLELGVCAVVVGLVAVVTTTIRHPRGTVRLRPGSKRAVVAPLRAVPLVIAVVAFTLGKITDANLAADLNLVGAIAAIGGVPLALPIALRAVGALFAQLASVPTSVAGRGMEWDPTRTARPFIGGAALVVLTLVGGGYIALARHAEAPYVPAGGTQAVVVEWLDHRPDDAARLANAIGAGLVVPFQEETQEGALTVGATCPQLAAYFPDTSCTPEEQFELPAEAKQKLAERLAVAAHGPLTNIQLVSGEDVVDSGSVFVLDKASLEILEGRVRGAAMQTLPAPYVYSWLSMVMRESPLVPWIVGGTVVAVATLAVGCIVSLVDRLLATRRHRHHLLNLGITTRQLTTMEAWLFAVPYGVAIAISFLAGLAICTLMVLPDVSIPWRGIGITLGVAVVVGLVGTVSAALFGARSVLKNSE